MEPSLEHVDLETSEREVLPRSGLQTTRYGGETRGAKDAKEAGQECKHCACCF